MATLADPSRRRTPGIERMLAQLGSERVPAGRLVDALATDPAHASYAGGRFAAFAPDWSAGTEMTPPAWVDAAEDLVWPEVAPLMHTRLLVLCLGLLSADAARDMLASGVLGAIAAEYVPNPDRPTLEPVDALTPTAQELARNVPLYAALLGCARPRRPSSAADLDLIQWTSDGLHLLTVERGGLLARLDDPTTLLAVPGVPTAIAGDLETALVVTDPAGSAAEQAVGRGSGGHTFFRGRVSIAADAPPNWALAGEAASMNRNGATASLRQDVVDVPERRDRLGVVIEPRWSRQVVDDPADDLSGSSSSAGPPVIVLDDERESVVVCTGDGLVRWVPRAGAVASVHLDLDGPYGVSVDGTGHRAAVLGGSGAVAILERSPRSADLLLVGIVRATPELGPVRQAVLDPRGERLALLLTDGVAMMDLRARAARARATFTDDRPDGAGTSDWTGTGADVEALAMLVASRELRPPLSIGLFGEWGSGKSTFMARLDRRVGEITAAARTLPQRDVEYWHDVVPVRFSAWEYASADLWASLMHCILGQLGQRPAAGEGTPLLESGVTDAMLTERRTRYRVARSAAWRSRLSLLFLLLIVVAGVLIALRTLKQIDRGGWLAVLLGVGGVIGVVLNQVVATDKAAAGTGGLGARLAESVGQSLQAERMRRRASADLADASSRSPGGLVNLYLQQQAGADDYRPHLGLVARVREDLTRIDEIVTSANFAATGWRDAIAAATEAPPNRLRRLVPALRRRRTAPADSAERGINRVVVYIDDLDRVPPARVVEVLEAVHLLLAFELFVVVLAVDTRWIEQSLRTHYRRLLSGPAYGAATPLDYIEKIIQLPYQVHPLTHPQAADMIRGLTDDQGVAGRLADLLPAPVPSESVPEEPASEAPAVSLVADVPEPFPPADSASDRQVDLDAEGLVLTAPESALLVDLAELAGTTPRTVKRFVNTYRVLKARSADPADFLQRLRQNEPATFEVYAILLAVVVGLEAVAGDVFAELAAGGDTFGDVLARVQPSTPEAAGQLELLRGWVAGRGRAGDDVQVYRRAAPVVARYSFATLDVG